MDIYENMIKQCNLAAFIIDAEGIIIDTNIYTMRLLDAYDISGKHFYSYLDEISKLKVKSCFSSGYTDPLEINLLASNGDSKPVESICSKVNEYLIVLGILKKNNPETLLEHLEDINIKAGFGIKKTLIDGDSLSEQDMRVWQLDNIDELTGLYNSKFFACIYNDWFENAAVNNKNSGIILLDIDFFKNLNNKYGHEKGDRILVGLSQIMLSCIRSTDYAIRSQGDEFLILLNNIKGSAVFQIAERIRQRSEEELGVTVSSGCISFDRTFIRDKDEFIRQVRKALELSKNKGRNNVTAV